MLGYKGREVVQTFHCFLFPLRFRRHYCSFSFLFLVLCSLLCQFVYCALSPYFFYDAGRVHHLSLGSGPYHIAFCACLVPSLYPAICLDLDLCVFSSDLATSFSRISRKPGHRWMGCGLVTSPLCNRTHLLGCGTHAGSCSFCLLDIGCAQKVLQKVQNEYQ